jgi:manganese transport protein
MTIACGCLVAGVKPVAAITVAQASTVIGLPALSLALLYLASRKDLSDGGQIPRWMLLAAVIGLAVTLLLTTRTFVQLWGLFTA